ncbi:2-keto-4-pentenoate hydratase [Planococcus ruber]|uniref:2-keto-4-pentenoate hydratase n=1 Tax=Planococcus ruber TaxID=2027871 RepID=UPI001FEF709A|nr:hypothetical protein [Planococcus ruber]MCJ1909582.1 hypothetical protein [Planococcus ruber]
MEQFDLNDQRLADTLFEAYIQNKPLSKDQIPAFLEKEKAYGIQHALTAKKAEAANEELKGYKISLTSKETQELFNSETPLYGALTSPAISGGTIELTAMSSPLIELELIFIAQEDLSAEDSVEAILQKTLVAPGIEVPDSRFEDWFPHLSLGQVIADSAVAGKIVIGKPKEGVQFDDLDDIQGRLTFNGEEIASDSSKAVLEHPVYAVKWLAEELAKHGLAIKKGMAISSGTFILPKKLEKGLYTASYEGIGEVSLKVI